MYLESSILLSLSVSHPIFIPMFVRWPLVVILQIFTLLFYYLNLYAMFCCWFNDLQIESNEGRITVRVEKTISNGFKIFLISEIMIFTSLIWGFIHLGLNINIWSLMIFPSRGLVTIFPYGIPLGNSLTLIKSSLPLQASLLWIKTGLKSIMIISVAQTIACTGFFIFIQLKEYTTALFTISDSMYGTNFYCATGLHGLHVGFALFCLGVVHYLMLADKSYKELHSTLKLCAYYWHLVDIVWIGLQNLFYLL